MNSGKSTTWGTVGKIEHYIILKDVVWHTKKNRKGSEFCCMTQDGLETIVYRKFFYGNCSLKIFCKNMFSKNCLQKIIHWKLPCFLICFMSLRSRPKKTRTPPLSTIVLLSPKMESPWRWIESLRGPKLETRAPSSFLGEDLYICLHGTWEVEQRLSSRPIFS